MRRVDNRLHQVEQNFGLARPTCWELFRHDHEDVVGSSVCVVRDFVDAGYGRWFAGSVVPGRLLDNVHYRTFLGEQERTVRPEMFLNR